MCSRYYVLQEQSYPVRWWRHVHPIASFPQRYLNQTFDEFAPIHGVGLYSVRLSNRRARCIEDSLLMS